jgi:hypothetical protein
MQVTVKAHFNKQTKDSKKELVQFYVKGEDEQKPELNELCREIVELKIADIDPLTAEFVKKTQDSKKTVIEFVVKGDTSAEHSYEFYRLAGSDVDLTISESSVSREDFHGKESDESDEDDENQMSIDDMGSDENGDSDDDDLPV